MPSPVTFFLIVEAVLITLSATLLTQPKFIFHSMSKRAQTAAMWGGFVFLIVTFFWSVILGMVFSLNDISFRI